MTLSACRSFPNLLLRFILSVRAVRMAQRPTGARLTGPRIAGTETEIEWKALISQVIRISRMYLRNSLVVHAVKDSGRTSQHLSSAESDLLCPFQCMPTLCGHTDDKAGEFIVVAWISMCNGCTLLVLFSVCDGSIRQDVISCGALRPAARPAAACMLPTRAGNPVEDVTRYRR